MSVFLDQKSVYMNGAAALPPKMTSNPTSKRVRIMGVSHHFLLCLRKCQNSLKNPPGACSANSEKLSALSEGGSDFVLLAISGSPLRIAGNTAPF